jgi:hypothetical protein
MDTWTCHVCGEERPDDKISVYQQIHQTPTGIKVTQNVRYCNDNESCVEGAKTHSFLDPGYFVLEKEV